MFILHEVNDPDHLHKSDLFLILWIQISGKTIIVRFKGQKGFGNTQKNI